MHRVNVIQNDGIEYQQCFETREAAYAFMVRMDEIDYVTETRYLGPEK